MPRERHLNIFGASNKEMLVQDWFKVWFNSPYYHMLYRDRDFSEAERFIVRLTDFLSLPYGSIALDLACGKGRHSLQLRKQGFNVIGLDLAEDSIEAAKQLEVDGLEFFVHDMRSLYWKDHFDLVVNLFTSFGYFHNPEDDQRTISSVADALKPGGIFVLDYMNVQKVIDNLVPFEEKHVDGIRFGISREVENDMIVKTIEVTDGDAQLRFQEEVDVLDMDAFSEYLSTAGLHLEQVFGNYSLEPFDVDASDRLIIVAKKPVV